MLYLLKVIKDIIVPPMGLLLAFALSLFLISKGRKRTAMALAVASLLLFYILSTDLGVSILMGPLERAYPPLKDVRFRNPYVVVLSGGAQDLSHLHIEAEPSHSSVKRLLKAIEIYKSSDNATLILAGGRGYADSPSIPEAMVLERLAKGLGLPEGRVIIEIDSRDTWENAKNIKPLLAGADRPVILVTSAFHMPRAVWCFEKIGVTVIPAPSDYRTKPLSLYSLIPSAEALSDSSTAISEYLSFGWYLLRK